MSIIDAVLADNDNFKFVSAVFAPYTGSKTYYYKTFFDVKEGDYCVVETPNNGFQVVQVTEVHSFDSIELASRIQYKWVVQVVDTAAYEQALEVEQQISTTLRKADNRRRRQELTKAVVEHLNEDERDSVRKLVRL